MHSSSRILQYFFHNVKNIGTIRNFIFILLVSSTMIKATSLENHTNKNMRSLKGSVTKFSETIIIRMGLVPDLPASSEKEVISKSIQRFLESENKNNHKFENTNVEYIRENLEMHRESTVHDILLILNLSGNYYTKNQQKAIDMVQRYFKNDEKALIDIVHDLSDGDYFSSLDSIKFVTDIPLSSDNDVSVADEGDDISSLSIDISSYMNQSFVVACILFAVGTVLLFVAILYIRDNKRSEQTVTLPTNKRLYTIDENNSVSTHISDSDISSDHRRSSTRKSIPFEVEVDFNKIEPGSILSPTNSVKRLNNGEEVRGQFKAPPGKLGVALDTVQGCPVVHKIKPGSPLHGVLMKKDWIVGIDEVDTTFMSAAEVTKLMVTRMKSTRSISYVRGADLSNSDDRSTYTNATM